MKYFKWLFLVFGGAVFFLQGQENQTTAESVATTAGESVSMNKTPSGRARPAYIILKLDDVQPGRDGNSQYVDKLHENWINTVNYLKQTQTKAGLGLIAAGFEKEFPRYLERVKEWASNPLFEIWFHAYDHETHKTSETDKAMGEFVGRTAEEQQRRFSRSQELSLLKLGVKMTTFGPPGGGEFQSPVTGSNFYDENTLLAIENTPEIHAMLYPSPRDKFADQIEASGKVTVLDRLNGYGGHGIERPLFTPNAENCLAGYKAFPAREYFVLQGHPSRWNPEKLEVFKKIIEELKNDQAIFVTPSEYVKIKKEGRALSN